MLWTFYIGNCKNEAILIFVKTSKYVTSEFSITWRSHNFQNFGSFMKISHFGLVSINYWLFARYRAHLDFDKFWFFFSSKFSNSADDRDDGHFGTLLILNARNIPLKFSLLKLSGYTKSDNFFHVGIPPKKKSVVRSIGASNLVVWDSLSVDKVIWSKPNRSKMVWTSPSCTNPPRSVRAELIIRLQKKIGEKVTE